MSFLISHETDVKQQLIIVLIFELVSVSKFLRSAKEKISNLVKQVYNISLNFMKNLTEIYGPLTEYTD